MAGPRHALILRSKVKFNPNLYIRPVWVCMSRGLHISLVKTVILKDLLQTQSKCLLHATTQMYRLQVVYRELEFDAKPKYNRIFTDANKSA